MYYPTATIIDQDGGDVLVNVTWKGFQPLDRPSTGGWSFPAKKLQVARRLARAINAGVVYKNPQRLLDVNGDAYIQAETTQFFHGRHMEASLRAVGF